MLVDERGFGPDDAAGAAILDDRGEPVAVLSGGGQVAVRGEENDIGSLAASGTFCRHIEPSVSENAAFSMTRRPEDWFPSPTEIFYARRMRDCAAQISV